MRAALAHYGTVFSFGRVPQTGELSGVAALCLTPDSWVDGWNAVYRARLAVLAGGIDAINRDVGCEVFQLQHPQGGWYFALRIAQHLFGADVTSGVHAAAVLLNYGHDRRDSGVAMLPGELFGYGLNGPQRWLTLRGSLAADPGDLLGVSVARLRQVALQLRGPNGPGIVHHALDCARAVADVDTILTHRRY